MNATSKLFEQMLRLADRSRLEACFQRFQDGTSLAEVLEPLQGMLPAAT